jgi:putative FmdB family regulatory protein
MPIYEFYCEDCHTVFNFWSSRVNTSTIPGCPRCARAALERRVSLFAVAKKRDRPGAGEDEDDLPGDFDLDDEKMERALGSLAGELENLDEEDPRQAAQLMRRLYETTGLRLGPGMEEAIRRMESGEDPEQIEEQLGDALEEEDPFAFRKGSAGLKDLRRRMLPPKIDETLYDL